MEKLKNAASINTSAGSKAPGSPVVSIKVFTKTGVLSKSRHTPPIVHARACLKIKNCTKHVFLSPFHDRIKKKGAFICQDVMN